MCNKSDTLWIIFHLKHHKSFINLFLMFVKVWLYLKVLFNGFRIGNLTTCGKLKL